MSEREPIRAADALEGLAGWAISADGRAIEKRFRFADFAQAFAFMTAVAPRAEALDHHPEWTNVYDRVEVRLTTHSAGGLTALDNRLARAMDEAAARLGVS